MNRLLDRKIHQAQLDVARHVEHERVALLVALAETANGSRQAELSEHAERCARTQHALAAYNALVMLRTELGE